MTIVTGIPNSLNRPQTFHTFLFLRSSGILVSVPLRIALIGAMRTTGTATPGVVYEATDPTTTDTLFGASSELALMCREAYACSTLFGRGPRVFAVAVAESAGVANVQTITSVGTATADSNIELSVAGRPFIVGVRSGDTQNTIATAVSNALKANQQNLPTLITVATNVVTATHATKGVNGVDVKIVINRQAPGSTLTVATGTAGTGATDHQPALDALAPQRYDGIAFANHASADITEINTDIATRWGASSANWGYYYVGEPGTIGTATALSAAANNQAVLFINMEGCLSTAGEMATAGAMLVNSRERPNANYDGAIVPLYPPPVATSYTGPEVETAIAAGLTPLTVLMDSAGNVTQARCKVERMVTSRTTTGGNPDDRNRDIGVSRSGVAYAQQINIAASQRFGADANPDGTLQTEDTEGQIRDMAAAIAREFAERDIFKKSKVEADIAATQVEFDTITLGRTNVALYYTVVLGQHQIAWVHNIQI